MPKQFQPLAGKAILLRTLETFHAAGIIDRIVVVLPEAHIPTWEAMDISIPHTVVAGGEERTDSVRNGLVELSNEGVIGIHDGVRPLASAELIARCFQSEMESAVPVLPIKSSVRKQTENGSISVERKGLFEVQTPQCFAAKKLKAAYAQLGKETQTDDATVFEMAGNKVHLVDGEERNIKITTPTDMRLAEALLAE